MRNLWTIPFYLQMIFNVHSIQAWRFFPHNKSSKNLLIGPGKTLVAWIGRRLPEGEAYVKAGQAILGPSQRVVKVWICVLHLSVGLVKHIFLFFAFFLFSFSLHAPLGFKPRRYFGFVFVHLSVGLVSAKKTSVQYKTRMQK